MAKTTFRAEKSEPVPEPADQATPATILECHAMARVPGGWRHFSFAIPEDVLGQYLTEISDMQDWGWCVDRLTKRLYMQRETGK